MPRHGDETRDKILRTAEQLFAREGVDRVTLRQIVRAAGQRNVAAVQYHFGSKEKLLAEILDHHLDDIDQRRREMLDAQERAGRSDDLGALLEVLVEPLVGKLAEHRGRAYLQIQAQRVRAEAMRPATALMVSRIARVLEASGTPDPDPLRDRFAVLLLFSALADRARQEESRKTSSRGRNAFAASLSQAILAIYRGATGDT
jgi:AcrR family transcriptional regulator